jgi:Uma2 family endonuclease
MAAKLPEPATYADLEAVPRERVAEIVGGVLHTFPRPSLLHARASSTLGVDLGGPFDRGRNGPGGWIILDEPELHLHGDILVPDLAGWRRERVPELPRTASISLAPDWVCEVLSPSTARFDKREKLPVYAREGVKHVWLVDPDAMTLDVYRLEADESWRVAASYGGEDHIRAEPFEAVELELGALWLR